MLATTIVAVLIGGIMLVVDWRLALCVLGALAVMLLLLAFLLMLWTGLFQRYNQATREMAEGFRADKNSAYPSRGRF
jgi:ABC-type bacteriocin/lantibiotic exporter with double-glycine peptidase domain